MILSRTCPPCPACTADDTRTARRRFAWHWEQTSLLRPSTLDGKSPVSSHVVYTPRKKMSVSARHSDLETAELGMPSGPGASAPLSSDGAPIEFLKVTSGIGSSTRRGSREGRYTRFEQLAKQSRPPREGRRRPHARRTLVLLWFSPSRPVGATSVARAASSHHRLALGCLDRHCAIRRAFGALVSPLRHTFPSVMPATRSLGESYEPAWQEAPDYQRSSGRPRSTPASRNAGKRFALGRIEAYHIAAVETDVSGSTPYPFLAVPGATDAP
ncbi:unnamed protein product [Trichogramma brassicae]|uniref:Uncharacterized protein n=1 Tax=Trichogramma brassicae TaxID=86971 RepID=A0A6H5I403_9HYME|nr:unnamed protein product [Trichogramma brassicae]